VRARGDVVHTGARFMPDQLRTCGVTGVELRIVVPEFCEGASTSKYVSNLPFTFAGYRALS
jgi:hypothetical protein